MAETSDSESGDCFREDGKSFRALIERARGGDSLAETLLVRQYEPEIRRFVRLRLSEPHLRRLLDSVDICQSVLARFFLQLAANQIEVQQPKQLLRLLTTMARNRLVDHVRKHDAQRRGGPLQRNTLTRTDVGDVADHAEDPGELVASRDLVATIRAAVPEDQRALVDERLLGFEWLELSEKFGQSPDALRKRFTRAIDRAARRLGLLEMDHE